MSGTPYSGPVLASERDPYQKGLRSGEDAARHHAVTSIEPRESPCAYCPYRKDVPSGIWDESEYAKLETYDGDTTDQAKEGAMGVFLCHTQDRTICSGWAVVHADEDNLALRIAGVMDRDVNIEGVLAFTTDVPLWPNGTQAAQHGRRDIENPGPEALAAIDKITRLRQARRLRDKGVGLAYWERGDPAPSGIDENGRAF